MSPAELQNAIEKVRNVVSGSDRVINVRGGFLFSDGWITSERCVVVSCRPDSVDEVRTLVPENMDGVPVDVTPATPQEQLAKLREGQGDRGERAEEVVERFATPGVEILEEADMGGEGAGPGVRAAAGRRIDRSQSSNDVDVSYQSRRWVANSARIPGWSEEEVDNWYLRLHGTTRCGWFESGCCQCRGDSQVAG